MGRQGGGAPIRSLGVIGVGAIASAIVDGIHAWPGPIPEVRLSPRGAASVAALMSRHPRLTACPDNRSAAQSSDVVLLSVAPQDLEVACGDLVLEPGTIVISAVAGVPHARLADLLGDHVTTVRAIPLPAVRHRGAPTVLHPTEPHARDLFCALGGIVEAADEETFDALSTVTGTLSSLTSFIDTVAAWLAPHTGARAAQKYVAGIAASTVDAVLADGAGPGHAPSQLETPDGLNRRFRRQWFDTNVDQLSASLDDLYRTVTTGRLEGVGARRAPRGADRATGRTPREQDPAREPT